MDVKRCTPSHVAAWLALRQRLWPLTAEATHRGEVASVLARPGRAAGFVALAAGGEVAGFAEATLRHDHVNGCATSPVGFLEGLYVLPEHRRHGAGRALVVAVEAWVVGLGCSELASDTGLGNTAARLVHGALGFAETEQVVFFRKVLRRKG